MDNNQNIVGFKGNVDRAQREISDICRNSCQPQVLPEIDIKDLFGRKSEVHGAQASFVTIK